RQDRPFRLRGCAAVHVSWTSPVIARRRSETRSQLGGPTALQSSARAPGPSVRFDRAIHVGYWQSSQVSTGIPSIRPRPGRTQSVGHHARGVRPPRAWRPHATLGSNLKLSGRSPLTHRRATPDRASRVPVVARRLALVSPCLVPAVPAIAFLD